MKWKLKCQPTVDRKACSGIAFVLSSSVLLYSAVFHTILISFMSFQQMCDECYDKAFILNIIDSSHLLWKRPGPLIGQVGSMSHLLCSQTSSNEQHHVITSFKEALCSDHRHRGVRSLSNSLFLSPESWTRVVMKQICSSRLQKCDVSLLWVSRLSCIGWGGYIQIL